MTGKCGMIVYGSRVWYVLNVVQCGAKLIPIYMIYAALGFYAFNFEAQVYNFVYEFYTNINFA